MIYKCCDSLRRGQLVGSGLNGIDYLEVLDRDAVNPADRQTRLLVHFINGLGGLSAPLMPGNLQIEGGERIRGIRVVEIETAGDLLTVTVDQPGDYSIYTLRLLRDSTHPQPPPQIDPMFAAVDFSFKVECQSDFDCARPCDCPPPVADSPEIDYLAKDYASFRRLLLDRISLLAPRWQERRAPDLGVALVEMLAYVGDYLSYQQDAVATEAYLGTARRRVSVRRHAKLVDYSMHDGCNARAWVQVQVRSDIAELPAHTPLCTRIAGQPAVLANDPRLLARAREVFETVDACSLFAEHNELRFYTWGDQRCCLPVGATSATLAGNLTGLKIGDVLVFEEVMGPDTGIAADADFRHRWPVRLTDVETRVAEKEGIGNLVDPLTQPPLEITQIAWAAEDALPFPLCISSRTDDAHGGLSLSGVSVARGNIVFVDHGQTLASEDLGAVPPTLPTQQAPGCDPCGLPATPAAAPLRYRPSLAQRPLTFGPPPGQAPLFGMQPLAGDAAELDGGKLPDSLEAAFRSNGVALGDTHEVQGRNPFWSVSDGAIGYLIRLQNARLGVAGLPPAASRLAAQDPRQALPAISLVGTLDSKPNAWLPHQDLLLSNAAERGFVVETESDGGAWLRFGDGTLGHRPEPGTRFLATYRVGNGSAGNVGADAIAHVVSDAANLRDAIIQVRNPLPATGGVDPESLEQVRAYAPAAFRTQQRAVTEADYAAVAQRHPQVQKAVATFRWTGSWHTVFITVDRLGGLDVDADFRAEVRSFVERFRMAGYDLKVDAPRFVSLQIELHVCVKPGYFREHVKAALFAVFNDRRQANGRLGVFHPDNFSFGQTVYLSPLVASAQSVEGVLSVQVTTFQRQGVPDPLPLLVGRLELGRLEIARCANDPSFAEHGVFSVTLGGGQ